MDLEQQLTELNKEFDAGKVECLAHQKVIQELKHSLEHVSLIRFKWLTIYHTHIIGVEAVPPPTSLKNWLVDDGHNSDNLG